MAQINLDYIGGLIDGDGSFNISISENRYINKDGESTPQFAFVINLRQLEKFEDVLKDVQDTLGVGSIYKHSHKGNFKMLTWQTTKAIDTLTACEKILPHLHIKNQECTKLIEAIKLWLESPRKVGPNGGRPGISIEIKNRIREIARSMNEVALTETSRRNKDLRDSIVLAPNEESLVSWAISQGNRN